MHVIRIAIMLLSSNTGEEGISYVRCGVVRTGLVVENQKFIAGLDGMDVAVIFQQQLNLLVVVQGVTSCMNKPTAVEAKTPFGQTTWGRPPAAPYSAASPASNSSRSSPMHQRQG